MAELVNQNDVFISYSSADADIARRVTIWDLGFALKSPRFETEAASELPLRTKGFFNTDRPNVHNG